MYGEPIPWKKSMAVKSKGRAHFVIDVAIQAESWPSIPPYRRPGYKNQLIRKMK
jgi:hypothetical protein